MKARLLEIAGGFSGVFAIAETLSNGAVSLSWSEFRALPNVLVEAVAIYQEIKNEKAAKK
jgi:hypothetical protein